MNELLCTTSYTLLVYRQRGSTVPEVTSPSAPPSVPAAPARPPKKAELAGRPLPPEQQGLPPLHGTIGINNISGGPGGDAAPLNALQPTPQPPDLQELQQVQMQQQQALLGGLRSPTSSESQQLGNSNPPNVVVPSETGPQSPPVPQVPVIPPTSVPDAAQALSSLQMLLQPDTQPLSPQQGLVVGAPTIATPAFLVPQRPPKPDHLKSGLLPSPFPSLPPPSEEQGTQPAVAKAHPSSFAGGTTLTEPGVDTGVPQTGGLYPETGSNVAGNSTLIPSDPLPGDNQVVTSSPGHLSLQSSTDSPLPPPTTSPVVWATATTGVGGSREDTPLYPPTSSTPAIPHSVSAEGTQHPVPLQDLGLSQTQSVLPMSPPYHHTNINILPGEVTVATSSILGPITSALAVEPATTSPASTLGMQAPPMQPAVGALPAPDARGQAQTAMSLPNLGDTFASGSGSLPSSGNQSGVPSTDPSSNQYTQSQDETVTGGSLQSDTPATNDDTSPARLWPGNVQRDLSEPQSTSSNASVSGSSPRVQFPQTGPSLQTMALPEIESQHQSTAAVDPPGAGPGSFSVLGSTDANLTTTLPNTTQMSSAGAATPPGSTSIQSDVTAGDPTSPATAPPSATKIPPSVSAMSPVGMQSLPSVMPLPLTTLESLTAPLEAPTDSTPIATELMLESLAPQPQQPSLLALQQIQALQQNFEDQKQVIEAHRAEKEGHVKQEAAYQQQIAQLQQQLHMLQLNQEQEKAAASDQQSALMKLLHQQQDMFSQQQSQMEKLSQQDESHRKEYLHVEEKFRESLRVEQEMKVSLQSQILQLMQENQKLNQTLQSQSQQVQALQLQLQQYNIHIQERDKQLVAFKDQHKEIVDKLEQRSQQKVAQLVQRIQELQLQLNQRPTLPQPLQPTVVHRPPQQLQQQNLQQNQDLGPAGLGQQPSLPRPLQPNFAHPMRPPHSPVAPPSRPPQASGVPPGPVPRAQTTPPTGDPMTTNLPSMRPSSSQPQPLQAPLVPMQVHPQNIPRPAGVSHVTIRPPSTMPMQQQHRSQHPDASQSQAPSTAHMQGQVRPGSLPPSQQGPPPPSGPHAQPPPMPQSTPQTPSTPGGVGALHPVSHSGTPPRPGFHPPLQSQASYPGAPIQQQQHHQQLQQQHHHQQQQQQQHLQQQMQQHLQPVSGAVFNSPSNPSMPQYQQAVMPRPMTQQQLPAQQPHMMGPRFPPQSMRPGLPGAQQPMQPMPTSVGQPSYAPRGPQVVHPYHPQYPGHAP